LITDTLKDAGFSPAANLTWNDDRRFEFQFTDANRRNVIYAYIDPDTERVLNVGHTGQVLRARLRDYQAWLNGRRIKENTRPIRLKWLDCFDGCSRVEVWAKPSSPEKAEREHEETELIRRLNPVLNVRA
jgi:hypothetical protein